MAEAQVQKKITITMKDDGMIDKVERDKVEGDKVEGDKVEGRKGQFPTVGGEIEGKYVATILYSHKSPGCWTYYLPNGESIEIIFPQ